MRTHPPGEGRATGCDESARETIDGTAGLGAVAAGQLQGDVADSSAGEVVHQAEEFVGCNEFEREEVGVRGLAGARREQDVGAAHHGGIVCGGTIREGVDIDIHVSVLGQLVERGHEELTRPPRGGAAGGRVPIPPDPDRVGHDRGGGVQLKSMGLVADER